MWPILCVFLLFLVVKAEPPPLAVGVGDGAAIASNMQKFAELYGMATQIMNLGSSFIGAGGNSAPSSPSSSYGMNGILADLPRYRVTREQSAMYAPKDTAVLAANMFSEYGGLQQVTRPSSPKSGFQTLLNSFLGSSVSESEAPLPAPPTPRPRPQKTFFDEFFGMAREEAPAVKRQQQLLPSFADILGEPTHGSRQTQQMNFLELFGVTERTTTTRKPIFFDRASGASDIDSVLNALMKSGARVSSPDSSSGGLLSQLFGR